MKVAELIKQLQALPQDDEVLLDWHEEIASIHRGHPWPQDTYAWILSTEEVPG